MSGYSLKSSSMAPFDVIPNGSDARLSAAFATDQSPLKVFVVAKRNINETFIDIANYVEDSRLFLNNGQVVLSEDKLKSVNDLSSMVTGIRDVLARDIMKVAFFGRTSNGKLV